MTDLLETSVLNGQVLTIISSDGHAGANMEDYRPYLESRYRDDFDRFLVDWNDHGSRVFDRPSLENRLDAEFVDQWIERMVDTGRVNGYVYPEQRMSEMDGEGVAAEVLFPDFGKPFELVAGSLASARGYLDVDEEHKQAGFRAFNRWLADYISVAPERFSGMGIVSWQQPLDEAARCIQEVRDLSLGGIVLPMFDPAMPLYHPEFDPLWDLIEDLGLVVNSHVALSSTSNRPIYTPGVPHPACGGRVFLPERAFFTHNILSHLIWGGVLERHPRIKVVFTEQGSGWTTPMIRDMDYAYEGSYFRTDYKDVIRCKPSEYFERQCYLGSSIFSQAEVRARSEIGIRKVMLGMDFPHHEGTIVESTRSYLRATLGAEQVPLNDARLLLCENAASVFGFDLAKLSVTASRIGLTADEVLSPPTEDLYRRGDVHKPLSPF